METKKQAWVEWGYVEGGERRYMMNIGTADMINEFTKI